MKIIKKNIEKMYIKEKSKFIGKVYKVSEIMEIEEILKNLKKTYNDATHICYAYILPNSQKYSDDNEPTGCAGMPILELLEKNELCYTLAVVIRYFGGIKLGSNGLIRAYRNTIKETLEDNIKELEKGYLIQIEENYNQSKEIEYLLKNSEIVEKKYQDTIMIKAIVNKKILDSLSSIKYIIIKEVFL